MANYQYIVSSLPQYSFDSESKGLETTSIVADLNELLSSGDAAKLHQMWWFFDLRNILSLLSGRKPIYSSLSNLSEEQTVKLYQYYSGQIAENEIESELVALLPSYAQQILELSLSSEGVEGEKDSSLASLSHQMWSSYYSQTLNSDNRFIREWNEFDLTVRNISAAFTARSLGVALENVIIGSNDITRLLLRNSSVADFGLKNEFAQIDELLSILSDDDMLNKERRLDKLRWQKIEELITFDYFTLECVLGYMVQLSLLERWNLLLESEGRKVLDSMVERLVSKENIKAPEAV